MSSTHQQDLEIERKFLIQELPESFPYASGTLIRQGYLVIVPGAQEVRLRHAGDRYFLTHKQGKGLSRKEYEIELTESQFNGLWRGVGSELSKIRYVMEWEGLMLEIDIFRDQLEGLVLAEVEFADEEEAAGFVGPVWFGDEVTGDRRFANQHLAEFGLSTMHQSE